MSENNLDAKLLSKISEAASSAQEKQLISDVISDLWSVLSENNTSYENFQKMDPTAIGEREKRIREIVAGAKSNDYSSVDINNKKVLSKIRAEVDKEILAFLKSLEPAKETDTLRNVDIQKAVTAAVATAAEQAKAPEVANNGGEVFVKNANAGYTGKMKEQGQTGNSTFKERQAVRKAAEGQIPENSKNGRRILRSERVVGNRQNETSVQDGRFVSSPSFSGEEKESGNEVFLNTFQLYEDKMKAELNDADQKNLEERLAKGADFELFKEQMIKLALLEGKGDISKYVDDNKGIVKTYFDSLGRSYLKIIKQKLEELKSEQQDLVGKNFMNGRNVASSSFGSGPEAGSGTANEETADEDANEQAMIQSLVAFNKRENPDEPSVVDTLESRNLVGEIKTATSNLIQEGKKEIEDTYTTKEQVEEALEDLKDKDLQNKFYASVRQSVSMTDSEFEKNKLSVLRAFREYRNEIKKYLNNSLNKFNTEEGIDTVTDIETGTTVEGGAERDEFENSDDVSVEAIPEDRFEELNNPYTDQVVDPRLEKQARRQAKEQYVNANLAREVGRLKNSKGFFSKLFGFFTGSNSEESLNKKAKENLKAEYDMQNRGRQASFSGPIPSFSEKTPKRGLISADVQSFLDIEGVELSDKYKNKLIKSEKRKNRPAHNEDVYQEIIKAKAYAESKKNEINDKLNALKSLLKKKDLTYEQRRDYKTEIEGLTLDRSRILFKTRMERLKLASQYEGASGLWKSMKERMTNRHALNKAIAAGFIGSGITAAMIISGGTAALSIPALTAIAATKAAISVGLANAGVNERLRQQGQEYLDPEERVDFNGWKMTKDFAKGAVAGAVGGGVAGAAVGTFAPMFSGSSQYSGGTPVPLARPNSGVSTFIGNGGSPGTRVAGFVTPPSSPGSVGALDSFISFNHVPKSQTVLEAVINNRGSKFHAQFQSLNSGQRTAFIEFLDRNLFNSGARIRVQDRVMDAFQIKGRGWESVAADRRVPDNINVSIRKFDELFSMKVGGKAGETSFFELALKRAKGN